MNISVILSTYKRPQELERAELSLRQQPVASRDAEVIVVDNAADPDIKALIRHMEQAGSLPFRLQASKRGDQV